MGNAWRSFAPRGEHKILLCFEWVSPEPLAHTPPGRELYPSKWGGMWLEELKGDPRLAQPRGETPEPSDREARPGPASRGGQVPAVARWPHIFGLFPTIPFLLFLLPPPVFGVSSTRGGNPRLELAN